MGLVMKEPSYAKLVDILEVALAAGTRINILDTRTSVEASHLEAATTSMIYNVDNQASNEAVSKTDAGVLRPMTTLTLKNVPATCTLSHVIATLDKEGFACCFDFVHAPVVLQNKTSLGYVHVNMLDCDLSERAHQHFQGFKDWYGVSNNIEVLGCIANWNTDHQGLDALTERYRNSPLMHESVPQEYKPAIFNNRGERASFPAPTVRLKPPRFRYEAAEAASGATRVASSGLLQWQELSARHTDPH
jgi:hypothetical protein